MAINIKKEYALDLLNKVYLLQSKIGDVPKIFLNGESSNEIIRPEGFGFDVNQFFSIFDKVKIKPGFTLDYTYYLAGIGGEPLIYARKITAPRISTSKYLNKYGRPRTRPYLKYLIIENNPESFFQLAMFYQIIHQFYLYWHANYNDHRFIFNREMAEQILESIPEKGKRDEGINLEDRKKMKMLSYDPQVIITQKGADVSCVMFSAWIGFFYKVFTITWPSITIDDKTDIIATYHCGILF